MINKLKNKAMLLYKSNYFPFVILVLGELILHFSLQMHTNDDTFFSSLFYDNDIFSVLVNRYFSWSSRVFIEFFLINIVNFSFLWCIVDSLMILLIAISISKIFTANKKNINYLVMFLIFVYPFTNMGEAGWVSTTLNYIWPLSLGLFYCISIFKILNNINLSWYECIFYTLSLIFASNQEQMCTILLLINLVFIVYLYLNQKKLNLFLLIQTILSILSIIFILTCPGNLARKPLETTKWFPDYANLNLFRKLEMGFSSSIFEFVAKPNIIFMIFSIILLLCMFKKHSNALYRYIACIPLVSNLVFGMFSVVTESIFPIVGNVKNSITPFGTMITLRSIKSWIPDLLFLVVYASILISLWLIFDDKKKSLLSIFIILLGFGSRMVMSFSPTIWASGERTFIFMYFSFIICSVFLYDKILISLKNIKIKIYILRG